MRTAILTATLAVFAGQASALSCAFGDAAVAYGQAESDGGAFVTVLGQMTWDVPDDALFLGGLIMEYEGQEFEIPARFIGETLLAGGARMAIDAPVTVMTVCINGDCGRASSGETVLTFLHETADGLVMNAYPCQSYPMGATEDAVALVQACLDGGPCERTLSWD